MPRNLLLLFMAVLLTGCGTFNCDMFNCGLFKCSLFSRRPPGRNHYVNTRGATRTLLIYSEKLKIERDVHLEDAKIYYNTDINRIRLDYSTMNILDMCEARELLVDLVEGLLEQLNADGFPLTPNNLEVYITFPSFYSTKYDLQTAGLISLRKGIAHYIASDAFYCDTDCWHRRYEPYHQSKDFVTFMREGRALYKPKEEKKPSVLEDERYNPIDFFSPSPRR